MLHVPMLYAVGAYLVWGVLPLYIGLLHRIPSTQIVLHRMVWGALFMAFVLFRKQSFKSVVSEAQRLKSFIPHLLLTTLLIGGNWFVYVYAVNNQHVLETSLGYFICPLFIVFLGRVILNERWNRLQFISIFLACTGVLFLVFKSAQMPVYALYLALSFALYALIRKKLPVRPLLASSLEVFALSAVGMAGLIALYSQNLLFAVTWKESFLLFGAGAMTVIPLWWFTEAAQRLPLRTVGILQFIAPCMQFFIALYAFNEPFSWVEAVSFGFIWAAVILYVGQSLYRK